MKYSHLALISIFLVAASRQSWAQAQPSDSWNKFILRVDQLSRSSVTQRDSLIDSLSKEVPSQAHNIAAALRRPGVPAVRRHLLLTLCVGIPNTDLFRTYFLLLLDPNSTIRLKAAIAINSVISDEHIKVLVDQYYCDVARYFLAHGDVYVACMLSSLLAVEGATSRKAAATNLELVRRFIDGRLSKSNYIDNEVILATFRRLQSLK